MKSAALPGALQDAAAAALGAAVRSTHGVGGGCISPVLRLEAENGASAFAKLASAAAGPAVLAAEAAGLEALRATGTVRVPTVLAQGEGWLLLEWLEPGSGSTAQWERLGTALAALHRAPAAGYGFEGDNFIGTLPQANPQLSDWPRFWWDARLAPQLGRAARAGLVDRGTTAAFERLRALLPERLAAGAAERPSLLHGDLWSGNVHLVAGGDAAVVDPSTYRGHREVDLAMAALFGGFPAAFWNAYESAWPLEPDGLEQRRAVYQLYYLLVHVNLFGAGYLGRTQAALRTALG